MKVLDHFSIPYQGLKNGIHSLNFVVDNAFFNEFENSFIEQGSFDVTLLLDKRPDMAIAEFSCKGFVVLPCDRCLAEFSYPMDIDFVMHVKFGDDDPSVDEVIFIHPEAPSLNVAQYIYEWISVSVPMLKMHENIAECDPAIISKLKDPSEIEEESKDSIWSSLKDLNLDN
jgi:uncharacterized protein